MTINRLLELTKEQVIRELKECERELKYTEDEQYIAELERSIDLLEGMLSYHLDIERQKEKMLCKAS